MSARIMPSQMIKCSFCGRHLASFAMRTRCVMECGYWLCRAGDCKNRHLTICPEYSK